MATGIGSFGEKTFVEALQKEIAGRGWQVVVSATMVGFANAGLLHCIQRGSEHTGRPDHTPLYSFAVCLVLFVLASRHLYKLVAMAVERFLRNTRIRLAKKIHNIEYAQFERLGAAEIYNEVSTQLTIIAETTDAIATLPLQLCAIAFNAVYLSIVSPTLFVTTAVWMGVALVLTILRTLDLRPQMEGLSRLRMRFMDSFMDLLWGSAEVKLREERGQDVTRVITKNARILGDETAEIDIQILDNHKVLQGARYAAFALVAFVVPVHVQRTVNEQQGFIAGLLLLASPMFIVATTYPALVRASTAAKSLLSLENTLTATTTDRTEIDEDKPARPGDPWGGPLRSLELRNVFFRYAGAEGFEIGPMNFSLKPAEIVFVVGSNGSGKSTLFRVLTGLEQPHDGQLVVNDVPVHGTNLQAYREMVAAVFTQFHLFSKLYGLENVDAQAIDLVIRELGLQDKVSYSETGFSTLNLSTGQRKRLALLVALLEDRQIMAFDEWTAEQDQEYRRYFYEHMLPELKRRGKTIVVVTHDDRFFHVADRLITLRAGRIESVSTPRASIEGAA